MVQGLPLLNDNLLYHLETNHKKLYTVFETISFVFDTYKVKGGEDMQELDRLFNQIYDSTYRATLIYVTAKCNNTEDISDIMQEIYTELYTVILRRGANYIKEPSAFVRKIAKSKVHRHYSLFARIRNNIAVTELDEVFTEDSFDLENTVTDRLTVEEVYKHIFSKPLITQKIFCMYFSLDMTISEISEALSVGESYVKNRLYRTLRELREMEDLI